MVYRNEGRIILKEEAKIELTEKLIAAAIIFGPEWKKGVSMISNLRLQRISFAAN